MRLAGALGVEREQARIALFVFLVGLVIGIRYQIDLWTFDTNGLSILSEKLPYWDFTNLWAGTKLAWNGQLSLLFDPEGYRATLRAMFNPALPDQEWSYPPSMLLIGTPLSWLPIFPAYLVWTFGTAGVLFLATKPLDLPLAGRLAITFSPAVLIDAIFGQNGALTGALIVGSLALLPTRPVVAGALVGLLTIKPHLGILFPFCMLASRNWRAIVSAGSMALTLFVLTGLLFGFGAWADFWVHTRPLMTAIMNAPFPQSFQANAATVFVTARAFGFDLPLAYLSQAMMTVACVVVACWIWRPANRMAHPRRVCLTGMLTLLATPYGYSYDCVAVSIAMVWLFCNGSRISAAGLGLVFLYPLLLNRLNYWGCFIAPLVFVTAALMVAFARVAQDRRANAVNALPEPTVIEPTASSAPPSRSDDRRPCAG